jgi:hypothetical protein
VEPEVEVSLGIEAVDNPLQRKKRADHRKTLVEELKSSEFYLKNSFYILTWLRLRNAVRRELRWRL